VLAGVADDDELARRLEDAVHLGELHPRMLEGGSSGKGDEASQQTGHDNKRSEHNETRNRGQI